MDGPRQPEAPLNWIRVSPDPISVAALAARVEAPGAGAVSLFLGTVRDHSEGKEGVTHLEYEAYPEMAEPILAQIGDEIRTIDGVKYLLADDSWLLVRPSGTEPVLRVYAEGRTSEMVQAMIGFGEDPLCAGLLHQPSQHLSRLAQPQHEVRTA